MGVKTLIPLLFTVFVLFVKVQGQKTSHVLCLAMGCYTKSLIRPPQCATLCDSPFRSFPPVGPPPIWSRFRGVGGPLDYSPPVYGRWPPIAPPQRPIPWRAFPPVGPPPFYLPPWRRLDSPPPPPPIGGPGYGLGYDWRRLDPSMDWEDDWWGTLPVWENPWWKGRGGANKWLQMDQALRKGYGK